MKKTNGITLISLIITIILMLILASITVTVAINGGLFEYAGGAKDSAEIANEKDIVSEAFVWAESNSKTGRVTVDELQKNIPTDVDTTVMDNGDTIVVKFNKNDRYYEIENNGKVQGPIELVKDDYAGDITKGGTCDGSADKPFKITCIEDLVAFSIMTNGGNSGLGLVSSQFTDQYVELTKTLDFKSIFSYNDYTTTIYGDLNKDGKVEDIKTELTRKDEGCIGFTAINSFSGNFDGKGNSIENIYIYINVYNKSIALFRKANEIKNLNLSGIIISSSYAGGIAVEVLSEISNCKNYANITGAEMVSGILLYPNNTNIISDCINYGQLNATGAEAYYKSAGGIAGQVKGNVIIKNCKNFGKIEGNTFQGGIFGVAYGNKTHCDVINCQNEGECNAGMMGLLFGSSVRIVNSYNIANCRYGLVERINYGVKLEIENCYNTGIGDRGIIGKKDSELEINLTNTYYNQTKISNVGVVTEGVIALNEEDIKNNATFIQTLNNNIGKNTEWKYWKIGEYGWPTFE